MNKPDILEVVSRYVELRKVGREYHGLCPLHDDRHPSLRVNQEKQAWYCDPCGTGGDVIRFIELVEKVSFPEALSILDLRDEKRVTKRRNPARERAAALLSAWLNEQHLKSGVLCRQLQRKIAIAESIPDRELVESLFREWEILSDLHGDLQNPEYAGELWRARESIETITAWANPEPLPEFPTLTESYRNHLRSIVC